MSDRSARGQLQAIVGELGAVHAFRWTPDARHRYTGWWMTPTAAAAGCSCDACQAASRGTDCYIGSVTRTAMYDAQRIALEHQPATGRAAA